MRSAGRSAFIAGGMVLLLAGVAPAQVGGSGSSGGSGSGGSFLGSSGGGSMGGSSSGSGGSFLGSSGGGSGGSFLGSSAGSTGAGGNASNSTSSTGATTQFGRYYDNPLYNGLATSQASSGSSTGSKYLRAAAVPTSFGNPLYNAASLTTTTTTRGATGIGTQGAAGTTPFAGANSAGIRRAPGYVTEPVFDSPPRPSLDAMRPELQSVVSRASRLPSRERIRVLTDGDTVVLRGQVRDERERRLAEAMIRLSPGVRLVRNELEPLSKPPK